MVADRNNQIVLVTGGAQGIGLGIGTAFANEGAAVILVDVDELAGLEAAASITATGGKAEFLHLDVSLERSVIQLARHIEQCYGRLDVLVNNAGVGSHGTLLSRSMEEWDRVMAINLRAPYMMVKYLTPQLRRSEAPSIVNICSTRALMSEANTEPYSASKGGLLALTHALAISLGPSIRVNAISPGWIEVSDWKRSDLRQTPHHSEEDEKQHPVGRVGTPADIAQTALFLSSPDSGFITGQNFIVDGGMTVKMIYAE